MKRASLSWREALGLGAAVFAVYSLAFWVPFLYDDSLYLLNNPDVTGPWRGFSHLLSAPLGQTGLYEPLLTALHQGLYALSGEATTLYRLTSLLLHWGNVLLVYALYRRLLGKEAPVLWLALLFALFPAHTEVLAISTFKKHLLVAGFGLLLLALKDRPGLPALLGCWTAMALALLSKESALILPALCLLSDLAQRKPLRKKTPLYVGLALICLSFIFWRAVVSPHAVLRPLVGGTWLSHGLTSAKSLLWYAGQFLWPLDLCQEHALLPVTGAMTAIGVTAGMALLCAFGVMLWRRDRLLGCAGLWTVLALTPFLNIPSNLNLSLIANRYLYLSSIGFFLGLGRWLQLRGWTGRPARLGLGALAALYAAVGMSNLARYSDPLDLWSHAVACAPQNPRAHLALGQALRQRGRLPEAVAEFQTGMRLAPEYFSPQVALNLALALDEEGRVGEALSLAREVAARWPAAVAYNAVGAFLLEQGKTREAAEALERALALDPADGDVLVNLGSSRFEAGRLDEAEALWTSALQQPPYRARSLCFLGDLHRKRGRKERAETAYRAALVENPFQLDAVQGLAALRPRKSEGLALFDELIERLERQEQSRAAPEGAPVVARALEKARAARRKWRQP